MIDEIDILFIVWNFINWATDNNITITVDNTKEVFIQYLNDPKYQDEEGPLTAQEIEELFAEFDKRNYEGLI